MLTMLGSGGERGPVILPAFKAGDADSVGVVGSTPTRFRQVAPRLTRAKLHGQAFGWDVGQDEISE